MGKKDIVSKTVLQKLAVDIATLLLKLDVEPEAVEVLEIDPDNVEMLDTERQRVEVRRADMVARMRDQHSGKPFIFHLEIQDSNDPVMPVRMMRYFTDIRFSYPDEPVRQYLVYIGKARLTMPDSLDNPGIRYCYRILDMHTVDCQAMMAMDKPEALVLAILCDFKERPTRDVLNSIIIRLKQLVGDDDAKLRNYFQMLETLAINRDLLDELSEAKAMLTEIDMKKLPSYKWGLNEGIERGMERGVESHAVTVATRLIQKGRMPDTEIAEISGLSIEQVQQIRQDLTH